MSIVKTFPVTKGRNDRPNIKLVDLSWLGLDFVLSVAWSFGVQLMGFFCSGISVVLFHNLGFSGRHNTFLSSPHL